MPIRFSDTCVFDQEDAQNANERLSVGGFSEIVFTGASKTFSLQYRTTNTASTVGIANARIEIWRVA
jgi:hypothetical protein